MTKLEPLTAEKGEPERANRIVTGGGQVRGLWSVWAFQQSLVYRLLAVPVSI